MTTGIVITTRNEALSIYELVRSFTRYGWSVYVVDDASSDRTVLLALMAGARVFKHEARVGIGPSLMEGWRAAREDGHSAVLQIDAGGSHRPNECLKFLDAANAGADLVIGSRFMAGASYLNFSGNWYRPLLSQAATMAMNYAQWGAQYTDWTSGYRYFSGRALDVLLEKKYMASMHGWQMEVLAYAGEAGLKIVEVPITYRAGRSSFNRKVAWEAVMTFLHVMHHVMYVGFKSDV